MTVRYDVDGAVATLTLDRPATLNSLDVATKVALLEALETARDDHGVRAVVLTGAGRAFCVGQDLREHAELLERAEGAVEDTVRTHFNPIALTLATMPKPVVAAVNGVAAGAGASFALAADFRLAAESASFLLAFAQVGLAADSGASWTLQRLVGAARATALLMLAEPVPAAAALEMGLVNAVVAGDALPGAAADLAARLAAGPTAAYAAIKDELAYASTAGLAAALEREAQLQAGCGRTQDHRSATAAFVARQQPVFTGR
jgi:2-(1,2-epoxy-1,2-dihydrophenyl)acetyl-CoA isomerase